MQGYDILMLVILGGAALFGAWKGFAWQIASFASITVSYFVACEFRDQLSGQINVDPPWNTFVAMLLLFLGTSLAIWMVFGMIRSAINRMKLKEFDRQAGFLLGLAKGTVVCVLVTLFAVTLLGETQRQTIIQSKSGYYIAKLLDKSESLMPDEVHQFLGPYIENFEKGRPSGDERAPGPFGIDGIPANIPGNLPSNMPENANDLLDQIRERFEGSLQKSSTSKPPATSDSRDQLQWSPAPSDYR